MTASTKPMPPPVSPPQPKAQARPAPAQTSVATEKRFAVVAGKKEGAQRVVIYGPGGIGKSTLAAHAPGAVFIDVEGGTGQLDVPRLEGVTSFQDLRDALRSPAMNDYQSVVIDSATMVEEWAVAHTIQAVPHEKGHTVKRLEDYGFGKGYQHVYDTFLLLLSDCDAQVRAGRNVVLIAHDCIADAPNPVGEDFIRYEPHLQSPRSGKGSIRNRVVQWADHVLFIGYDVIAKDGKGKGGGTRTIWPVERPDHVAKSRSLSEPVAYAGPDDTAIWAAIFGGADHA